jgi:hypothetical protein
MVSLDLLLLILAFVAFLLAAFGLVVPRVNLVAVGLMLYILTLLT